MLLPPQDMLADTEDRVVFSNQQVSYAVKAVNSAEFPSYQNSHLDQTNSGRSNKISQSLDDICFKLTYILVAQGAATAQTPWYSSTTLYF